MSDDDDNTDKRDRKCAWKPSFPYSVDYNDHFETPLQAYRDVQPLMDIALTPHEDPILYDPYYCDGQTKVLLHSLGYRNVIHEKRDFYHDVENDTVPAHHLLVTNPPYSEAHKQKCFEYVLQHLHHDGIPFCLLLPTYVATKSYFQQLLQQHDGDGDLRMAYLVPAVQDYAYHHPEGTGKDASPFASMWFCGLPRESHSRVQTLWSTPQQHPSTARLYTSLAQLERAQVITTQHRPNPRQRQKKKRKRMEQSATITANTGSGGSGSTENAHPPPHNGVAAAPRAESTTRGSKKSKYRDDSGKRKRRRF